MIQSDILTMADTITTSVGTSESNITYNSKISSVNTFNFTDGLYYSLDSDSIKYYEEPAVFVLNETEDNSKEKGKMEKTFTDFMPVAFEKVNKKVAYFKNGIAIQTSDGKYKAFVPDEEVGSVTAITDDLINFPCFVVPEKVENIKPGDYIYVKNNFYVVVNSSEKKLVFDIIDFETNEMKQLLPMAVMGEKYFSKLVDPLHGNTREFFRRADVKDYFEEKKSE